MQQNDFKMIHKYFILESKSCFLFSVTEEQQKLKFKCQNQIIVYLIIRCLSETVDEKKRKNKKSKTYLLFIMWTFVFLN